MARNLKITSKVLNFQPRWKMLYLLVVVVVIVVIGRCLHLSVMAPLQPTTYGPSLLIQAGMSPQGQEGRAGKFVLLLNIFREH